MTDDIGTLFRAISTTENALAELVKKRNDLMKEPPAELVVAVHLFHRNVCKAVHTRDGYGCQYDIERSWASRAREKWLMTTCKHIASSGKTVSEYTEALHVVFASD